MSLASFRSWLQYENNLPAAAEEAAPDAGAGEKKEEEEQETKNQIMVPPKRAEGLHKLCLAYAH